ncbi:MAG: preprotein translocase subunit SecY [Clostridia bacterium]|nr:preprotein translocase subunit SecY [Clostridia bacterium]
MFQTLINAFKIKEIRRKIFITLALLLVYRIGCYIPVPGMYDMTEAMNGYNYLQIMGAVTGGALQYGTLFAMGIGPYINASIIIQLLAVAIPSLEQLSKQGEEGRKKIANYTRYLTLLLAVAQSIGIIIGIGVKGGFIHTEEIFNIHGNSVFLEYLSYAFLVIVYTAGAAVTMWLGERITDYGVSNGISMLIFTGILATAAMYIINQFEQGVTLTNFWVLLGFAIACILIFAAIVTVDSAERKIPVQYAKQVKGRKMYGGSSTNIPIKVNSSGVMPLIFAFAILSFPELIMNLFGLSTETSGFYAWWATWVGTESWLYKVLLCALILFFSYFYQMMQFNPEDISKSIQSNGGYIPGIRPGKPTTDHLKKISNRITLFGAIYLALVALIPSIVFGFLSNGLTAVFSATGLLIVVSVALEFNQALESQIMMKNYKGFLK